MVFVTPCPHLWGLWRRPNLGTLLVEAKPSTSTLSEQRTRFIAVVKRTVSVRAVGESGSGAHVAWCAWSTFDVRLSSRMAGEDFRHC